MNEINKQYNRTSETFKGLKAEVENDITRSSYEYSLKTLLHFSEKIDELFNIMQLIQMNLYTTQVLLRVVFDHYLILLYISMNTQEKDQVINENRDWFIIAS